MDTDGISLEVDNKSFEVLNIGPDEIEPIIDDVLGAVGEIVEHLSV